jgi:hypothetical protein
MCNWKVPREGRKFMNKLHSGCPRDVQYTTNAQLGAQSNFNFDVYFYKFRQINFSTRTERCKSTPLALSIPIQSTTAQNTKQSQNVQSISLIVLFKNTDLKLCARMTYVPGFATKSAKTADWQEPTSVAQQVHCWCNPFFSTPSTASPVPFISNEICDELRAV